jgi:hypothetical protein
MSSVIVVIVDVLIQEALEMTFIQDDHMVEEISTATPNPSFRNAICQGLRKLVRLDWIPRLFSVSITSSLKFNPRSKIKKPGAKS